MAPQVSCFPELDLYLPSTDSAKSISVALAMGEAMQSGSLRATSSGNTARAPHLSIQPVACLPQ